MEIRIAVTNLGAYNEGRLLFEWITLPYTDDEFKEALQKIEIDGKHYEEYFISDYEAPFQIDEYENIERLNDVAYALLDVDYSGGNDVEDVINLAYSAESARLIDDALEHVGDIVDDEQLDELVENIAQEGGWRRVRYFLKGIEFADEEYYRLNGYGNAESLTCAQIDSIIDDVFNEIKANA